jgi:hypothetical protein
VSNKDKSSIKNDDLWDATVANNVCYVELDILSDSVGGGYGYVKASRPRKVCFGD